MTGFLYQWRRGICERSKLPPTARHVALALSIEMEADGTEGNPGAERVAHLSGLSVRTVRSALALLTAAGWLELVREGGIKGGTRTTNEYRAAIPRHLQPAPPFTGASDAPVQPAAPKGAGDSPCSGSSGDAENYATSRNREHSGPVDKPSAARALAAARADLAAGNKRSRVAASGAAQSTGEATA